jgi:hypothetical protein
MFIEILYMMADLNENLRENQDHDIDYDDDDDSETDYDDDDDERYDDAEWLRIF